MDYQKVLETRRSIRHYDSSKRVSKEDIEALVHAASLAPSWKNVQPGRYYCIMGEEKLQEFCKKCLPAFNAKNAEGASALVVTTFVKSTSGFEKNGQPCNNMGECWGAYDLGLQNENLVLKAQDMGLATLIMGIRDEKAIRHMLSIPEEEAIAAVISVGYGTTTPKMPPRKEVEEILTFI